MGGAQDHDLLPDLAGEAVGQLLQIVDRRRGHRVVEAGDVEIPELADENTAYDREKYYKYLLRAAESILLPFGYTAGRLDGMMKGRVQGNLCEYLEGKNF